MTTNYERIKNMTIEAIAELIQECNLCKLTEGQTCENTSCKQGITQFLEAEVEE
jgi:hypothetical protein